MKFTPERFVEVVITGFLATGEDLSVADIAKRAEVSEATVRKVINLTRGCPKGLQPREEYRESFSKNYNMQTGAHKVWVYGPTRDTLRLMILHPTRKYTCPECDTPTNDSGVCVYCVRPT
jgi:hypothetical protein